MAVRVGFRLSWAGCAGSCCCGGELRCRADTYRFLDFLSRSLKVFEPPTDGVAIDVGTGGGAGALLLRHAAPKNSIIGLDINPSALSYAHTNFSTSCRRLPQAGAIDFRESDLLSALSEEEKGSLHLVVSNPPYIAGAIATYADGGDELGLALPWRIAVVSLQILAPGGLLMLYTGVPIDMQGHDPLLLKLETELEALEADLLRYEVIDVDVFGDELEAADGAYGGSDTGRIAVIGCVVRKGAEKGRKVGGAPIRKATPT